MQTVLVTGSDGYVGRLIVGHVSRRRHVIRVSRRSRPGPDAHVCDLANLDAVTALARRVRPDVIVHAAGNKNLPYCEATPAAAFEANAVTVSLLREAFTGVPFIYISTDYVFGGTEGGYDEASAVAPRTHYGRSKLAGELAGRLVGRGPFVALRLSALYDSGAAFLSFLRRELGAGRPVECFVDAFYSPTFRDDLFVGITWLLDHGAWPPVLHLCGDRLSRYGFAVAVADSHGFDPSLVRPVTLDQPEGPLFPDLSLSCAFANRLFGFVPTPHGAALAALASEGVPHARA